MFAFDLKAGYHHVKIVKHHGQFLGFYWGVLISPIGKIIAMGLAGPI